MSQTARSRSRQSQFIATVQRLCAPVLHLYDATADYISKFKVFDLVAFLTAYATLEISHTPFDVVVALVVIVMTCWSKIRNHCCFWFGIAAIGLFRMIYNFHRYEDHSFFLMYWCLALGLVLVGKHRKFVLRKSGRLLIGICFAIGCVWKIVSFEFTDTSVFHYTLLFDYRMAEVVTEPIGGITSAVIAANHDARDALYCFEQPDNVATLDFPNRVSTIAWLMTGWTIAIEGAIAFMFLLPSSRIADKFRDWTLVLFMLSTYLVVPVLGFASTFVALGVAQANSPRTRLGYMLTLLVLLVAFWVRFEIF